MNKKVLKGEIVYIETFDNRTANLIKVDMKVKQDSLETYYGVKHE